MHAAYVACLFAGALATVLFAVLGVAGAGSHGHAGHHGQLGSHGAAAKAGHASHHAHGYGHQVHATQGRLAESLGWIASWFSPLTVAAAALWFGGIGLLAETSLGSAAVVGAAAAAVIGAAIVRAAFMAFLRADTPPLAASAEGAVGTVNATIRPNAPGEVMVTLEGLHRAIPARSVDGRTILRGTPVAVVERRGGFALVTPLDPLESAPGRPELAHRHATDGADRSGEAISLPQERKE